MNREATRPVTRCNPACVHSMHRLAPGMLPVYLAFDRRGLHGVFLCARAETKNTPD